jgi:hypothetical protein
LLQYNFILSRSHWNGNHQISAGQQQGHIAGTDASSQMMVRINMLLRWYQLQKLNVQLTLFKSPKYTFSRKTKHGDLSDKTNPTKQGIGCSFQQ